MRVLGAVSGRYEMRTTGTTRLVCSGRSVILPRRRPALALLLTTFFVLVLLQLLPLLLMLLL